MNDKKENEEFSRMVKAREIVDIPDSFLKVEAKIGAGEGGIRSSEYRERYLPRRIR